MSPGTRSRQRVDALRVRTSPVSKFAFPIPDELVEAIAERVAAFVVERFEGQPPVSPWLDVPGACAYLGMSKDALYKLTAPKPPAIPLHRIGSRIMFRRDELDAWLDDCYEGPARLPRALR